MNPPKSFIDFIDDFANRRYIDKNKYHQLDSCIQHHFVENKLYDAKITGSTTKLPSNILYYPETVSSQPQCMYFTQVPFEPMRRVRSDNKMNDPLAEQPHYYSLFTESLWNTSDENTMFLNTSAPIVCRTATPITEKIHIDVSLNNIQNLIDILNTYECKPHIEYNINLQFLENIKAELVEINAMVGMEALKKSILEQLIYFVQELHVGKNVSDFKHTAIFGPPGTGKTEIAKIIGRMYSKLGILKNNVFKKVTRNDLVAGYLGQTAIKTTKVINECLGGVLFIDEAYSLASKEDNDTFSKECIDTLCEALSDHKNDIMVIVAGYENELNETFFRVNRGMESRFIWRFKIDGYDAKQLCSIFKKMVREQEWDFENEADVKEQWFDDKKKYFANYGRDIELLVVYTKIAHGKRIYGKPVELRKKISIQDINAGFATFEQNKQIKKAPDYLSSLYV